MDYNFTRMAKKLSIVTVSGNVVLAAFKLFAGIFAHSGAMISDAVHSMSDVITTVVAYIGMKLSEKDADEDHPYGHERLECVAALILGGILMLTGIGIGYDAVVKITAGNYTDIAIPGALALVAAVVSIAVKEAMYWYTRHYALIMDSSVFMADAWHHRTDAISSVGALIGIAFSMAGYAIMDTIASVIICLFILKASVDIIKDTINKMTDHACSPEDKRHIEEYIRSEEGVLGIDLLRTRLFGNRIYVEAEIIVWGDMSLRDAHAIAERVHDGLEKSFPKIKHIMIHVNPSEEDADEQDTSC
ncbi:MAG: cation diffusion facilitator family transporter [Lachnospiraceae bacterium]|jgi:cation diffusion facilitator family transporter